MTSRLVYHQRKSPAYFGRGLSVRARNAVSAGEGHTAEARE